jgi:hypothetical protein
MAFQGVIKEAMSMLQAEEDAVAAASSSTRGPKRRRRYINRTVIVKRLISCCGTTTSTTIMCTPSYFCRRYRMRMTLFLSIMHKLSETSLYFCKRYDVTGHAGLTVLQKCTDALRQLAFGMDADTIDEYLKLEKTTVLECLEYYCSGIIACFRDEFLRRPTVIDTQHLLAKTEERGFSVC